MSYAAAIALGHAIRYINTMSLGQVATHNAELASQVAEEQARRAAKLLTPADPHRRAGTVTARFPGRDGKAIAAELTCRGVIVSPRVGSTRFSMHFYKQQRRRRPRAGDAGRGAPVTATRTSDWAARLGKAREAVAAALLPTPLVDSPRLGQGVLPSWRASSRQARSRCGARLPP